MDFMNFRNGQKLQLKELRVKQVMSKRFSAMYRDLKVDVRNCYEGKNVLKIEVKNGCVMESYSGDLLYKLKKLKLRENVQTLIEECKNPVIKSELVNNVDHLVKHGENIVNEVANTVNGEFEINESLEISKKLIEPQVYNLTHKSMNEKSHDFSIVQMSHGNVLY